MKLTGINIFLFCVGLSRLVMFNVGGELFLADILLTASFVLLMGRGKKYLLRGPCKLLLALGALWMLNALITDIYRGTPFEDWSRGWAKIIFFFLDLAGIILLTELKFIRITAFIVGIAFSFLIEPELFPKEYLIGFLPAWKFAYSPALTTLAALVGASTLVRRSFGVLGEALPLAILGILNLFFNFRSMFGIAMAAVVFGLLKRVIDSRPQLRAKVRPLSFLVLICAGVALSQGLVLAYTTAAGSGWLGADAQDKFLSQSSGNLSLILSGRAESLVSTQAIMDSPVIGHGSWAKDINYVSMLVDILEANGLIVTGDPYASALIPSHSHLLGTWVEAGLMGGVFWMAVMGLGLKAVYATLRSGSSPPVFVGFILFLLIWDIVFSPFGAAQRFLIASKICLALWALKREHLINPSASKGSSA